MSLTFLYHIIIGSLLVFKTLGIAYTQIIAGNGKCLTVFDHDRDVSGGKVAVWKCDSTNPNQKFWYDSSSKKIYAFGGLCLDNNHLVTLYSCQFGLNRIWDYSDTTKQFKPRRDNSLCLTASDNDGDTPVLIECDSSNTIQQWSMPSGCKSFESTIMLKHGVFACRGTFKDGLNSDSAKNLCGDGYNICTMDSLDFYGLKNDECANNYIFEDCSFYASKVSSNGHSECIRNGGTNDVWGCGKLPWNKVVCNNQLQYSISHNGISNCNDIYKFGSNHTNELNEIDAIHNTKSGVMCCKNDAKNELLALYDKFIPTSEYGENQKKVSLNIISKSNSLDYSGLNDFKNTLNAIIESNKKATSVKIFEKVFQTATFALASVPGERNNGLGAPILSFIGSLVSLIDNSKPFEQTLKESLDAFADFIKKQFDNLNYRTDVKKIDDELQYIKAEITNYWIQQQSLTSVRATKSINNEGCLLQSSMSDFEKTSDILIHSTNFFPIALKFVKARINVEEYTYAQTSVDIFYHYARLSLIKLEVLSVILSEWNIQYKCNQLDEMKYGVKSEAIKLHINKIFNDIGDIFNSMFHWDDNPLHPFYIKFKNMMSNNNEKGQLLKAVTNIFTENSNVLKKILNRSPDTRADNILNYINNYPGSWSKWQECQNDGAFIKQLILYKHFISERDFCSNLEYIYSQFGGGLVGITALCSDSDNNKLLIGKVTDSDNFKILHRYLPWYSDRELSGFTFLDQCKHNNEIIGVGGSGPGWSNTHLSAANVGYIEAYCDTAWFGSRHSYWGEFDDYCRGSFEGWKEPFKCPDNQYICGVNVKIHNNFIRGMVFDCCYK